MRWDIGNFVQQRNEAIESGVLYHSSRQVLNAQGKWNLTILLIHHAQTRYLEGLLILISKSQGSVLDASQNHGHVLNRAGISRDTADQKGK